jgi:two-component system cell cycle sensor histidine kinase/response regulator CckA
MLHFWNFLTEGSFIPHGHCYLWKPDLVWLHIISDSMIALAYYSIPLTLVYFVRKRQDLPFNWMFLLFGSFIIACGTTHIMEVWTLWHPTYWLSGFIKAITAIASLFTAALLVPLVPQALNLPSPALLEAANRELQEQIIERKRAEAALQKAHHELEVRVQERTAELATANKELQAEISEHSRAEQKIREQAALLDITTDAILVRDLENKILFWNKGAENIYGWKAEEVLGNDARQLLSKENSPQLEEAFEKVKSIGSWQGDLNQVTKAGKEIIVSDRWTLVRDEGEEPKSMLTVSTDITEKKQLEAQFLRAQRLDSLGTLAGGIAHDLNNVLAPILMAVQLLQLKITDSQSQQWLDILESSVIRGANLVKQVLSFARGIAGDRTILELKHQIFEIKQIVSETFPKSIQVYTDIPEDLWLIYGDPTQLHQVLLNLVVNARDAMPNGGTLNICAENIVIDENYARMTIDAQIGEYIVINVSDTGTGISQEIKDKIFEPFFTTKEQGKGTGLGLSTAIGIIKSHGGFVNVYSELGKGTQFKVYLPATALTETQVQIDDSDPPAGQGELILVVDDEYSICEITKLSLEVGGYKVITAHDGIEAIALYAQHQSEISVVVTDMMMPSMDGTTTIHTLEKMNPNAKIVAVSGLASNNHIASSASTTVKSFLSKPYTAKQLLKTIHNVMIAKDEE